MTMTTEQVRVRAPALELFQDERKYAGVEFRELNLRHHDKQKPLRLTLFNNNYGTFEVSFDLTRDAAQEMRDWLTTFLDHNI